MILFFPFFLPISLSVPSIFVDLFIFAISLILIHVTAPSLSIHPFIYSSIYLFIYLYIYLSIYLSIHLSVYLSSRLSICISIYSSICISIYSSICISICPSSYSSICISIYPSIYRLCFPRHLSVSLFLFLLLLHNSKFLFPLLYGSQIPDLLAMFDKKKKGYITMDDFVVNLCII